MKARFFRVRFRNNGRGIYHTLAYRDEIEGTSVHLSYVGEGGTESSATHYPIDVLVAADLEEETLRQTEKVTEEHSVDRLYLPKIGERSSILERIIKKAGSTRFLDEDETVSWNDGLWEFWIGNLGGCLSLYHGFAGTKELGEDCIYVGKIYGADDYCSPCLLEEKDFCGFGCLHHRDFHRMKAHENSWNRGFRTGTLLLGKGVFQGKTEKLLKKVEKYKEKLRTIQLPHKVEIWDRKLLNLMAAEEIQYYVGHSGYELQIPGEIVCQSGYCHYIPADCERGLCLSGYFIPFQIQNEKSC